MRNSVIWVAMLASTSGVGCKKSSSSATPPASTGTSIVEQAQKKSVAEIETRLAAVQSLKGKLAPSTTRDGVTLDKEWSQQVWVYEADLGDVGAAPTGPKVREAESLRNCVKEARTPDFGKHTFDKLSKCESMRYLFVVRTLNRVAPKFISEGTATESSKFSPGTANGDVLVYDIKDKKHLGGYRWKATNDSFVVGKGPVVSKNFEDNIVKAIESGATENVKH